VALPLEGIRVLDMTFFQQGPYAAAMLADMGADVIKIESAENPDPGRGSLEVAPNGMRAYFEHLNRNKRGICLDLKNPEGREVLLKLVETADIFHNNMRPGVMERLNLTYEVLREHNPRIIMSNATGWGHLGPDAEAHLGSMDILAQARGGIISVTGAAEVGNLPVGVPFADHVGAIISAYGMMVALWERERSGEGQELNSSLYGGQLCIQGFNITSAMWSGQNPPLRSADEHRPHWRMYECADGKLIQLGAGTPDRWWKDFCDTIGCPEAAEGVYGEQVGDLDWCRETGRKVAAVMRTKTRDEWMAILSPRFFVQPVRNYLEIAEDPQAWANGYIVEAPGPNGEMLPTVGLPVHLSRTPGSVRHYAPQLGQHTEEVLLEAGYTWDDITRLRDAGAFGRQPSAV
jgi:CoA:oxalate CoA-transferase